jgi:hypothetical protein
MRKNIKSIVILVIAIGCIWLGYTIYKNAQFHVVSVNPSLSKISVLTPSIDVNFNDPITSNVVATGDSFINSVQKISSKTVQIGFATPLKLNQKYSINLGTLTSTNHQKINNLVLVFKAGYINFNNLSKAQQQQILSKTDTLPPSLNDPIVSHLPYGTLDFNLTASPTYSNGKTSLVLNAQLLIPYGYLSDPTAEQALVNQYKQEVVQYITSLGLNPNNYNIQYTIS